MTRVEREYVELCVLLLIRVGIQIAFKFTISNVHLIHH